ncbi:MAG: DUF1501 domain-containing protein, partial [Gammaproteobacteria bacterium]|nr:DUF1501 domain-containing protein [Gammaproteobacteria bacterium]
MSYKTLKQLSRREFLHFAMAAGSSVALGNALANPLLPKRRNVLVLIELQGANDGLNTLIPYADPAYYDLRPSLAISRDDTLQLTEKLGLHPSMPGFLRLWKNRQLAIVQGLGYPEPSRSHFRSIEIWETASASNQVITQGWLSGYLNDTGQSEAPVLALALGQDAGPLSGSPGNTLVMDDFRRFVETARQMQLIENSTSNDSLRHILMVQNSMQRAALSLAENSRKISTERYQFPATPLGGQLQTIAELIINDSSIEIYKLGLGSFDTHAKQKRKHARLLEELSGAVDAFQKAMQAEGQWDNVLMMTYSEFGRRARENGSQGTDHG